jgi:SnoaL-like domain
MDPLGHYKELGEAPPCKEKRGSGSAVSDRDDITALVHSYAELLDSGRLSDVVALFSRATWRSAGTRTSVVTMSEEEVRATYDRVILYEDGTPRTHHLITNLTIEVAGETDEASGSCYFTVLQGIEPGRPIEIILSGRYSDRYRKDEQGWYFTDRVFTRT